MNFRNTSFLFGLLLSMLWIFGLMLAVNKTALDLSRIMPTLQDAVVDEMTIQRNEDDKEVQPLRFVHSGDNWLLRLGDNDFRVDRAKLDSIVADIKTASKSEEERVLTNSAENGLDRPRLIVKIKGKVQSGKTEDDLNAPPEKSKRKKKYDVPKDWVLKIGKNNAAKTAVFVSSSDRPNRVFAVARSTFDNLFFSDVNQLRVRQLFDLGELAVKKLQVKEAKDSLEIKRNDDETWRIEQPDLGPADYEGQPPPKTPAVNIKSEMRGVKGLIASIESLRVLADIDFITPSADLNLARYDLEDGKESLRVQLNSTDDKTTETLLVGSKTSDAGDDGKYFACMQGDKGVFKLTGKQLKFLRDAVHNPGQFRSKDLTFVSAQNVDKVKETIFGKDTKDTIELTRPENKPWELRVGEGKPARANEQAVSTLIDSLAGKRAIQSFLNAGDERAKKIDAEKILEVELFAVKPPKKDDKLDFTKDKEKDKEKKAEKGESKLAATLTFGAADKDSVAVKRVQADKTTTFFTIDKSVFDKIHPPQLLLVYLDTALPTFAEDDVVSLTLNRGKEPIEVVRGTGPNAGRWIFKNTPGKSEATFADARAIDDILETLGQLHAVKWVQKIDARTDLAKMGLEPAKVQATIVVKKWQPTEAAGIVGLLGAGDEVAAFLAASSLLGNQGVGKGDTVEVRFGNETTEEKDKPNVYARHSGSELLFLVEPSVVRGIKTAELRDRSMVRLGQALFDVSAVAQGPWDLIARAPLLAGPVVSLNPAKVKDVSIELHTVEYRKFHFVRRDKTWKNESGPPEFTLDPDKVNALLEKLAKLSWGPRTARLVTLVDGPRSDYKLDAKEAYLKVDLTLDSGQVVTLSVGDLFERGAFFAQFSSAPKTVFLLSRGWAAPFLDGVGYFGKDRLAAGD